MGVAVVHLLLLLELHRMKEVCFGRGVGRMLEISLSVVVCVRCLKGVESVMNSIVIVCYVQPLFYIYISYRSMYCMILSLTGPGTSTRYSSWCMLISSA